MKKKIIIIISIIGVIALVGICYIFRNDLLRFRRNIYPIHSIMKSNDNKENNQNEELVNNDTSNKSNEQKAKQENIGIDKNKEENKTSKQGSTKTKSNTRSTASNNSNKSNEQSSQQQTHSSENNNDSGVVDQNGTAVQEEKIVVIKNEPWEQAGVSEYDWYHKPVYSWMRVDYPISSCGSVSNCESLCMKDAEELSYTENVSCIQVHTYSGKYLGEMLKRD